MDVTIYKCKKNRKTNIYECFGSNDFITTDSYNFKEEGQTYLHIVPFYIPKIFHPFYLEHQLRKRICVNCKIKDQPD